jgi:hypothetical protein
MDMRRFDIDFRLVQYRELESGECEQAWDKSYKAGLADFRIREFDSWPCFDRKVRR